jgi:hypothetical protein
MITGPSPDKFRKFNIHKCFLKIRKSENFPDKLFGVLAGKISADFSSEF